MTLGRRSTPLISLLFGLIAVAEGASPKPLAGNEDFALTRQKSTLGRRSEGIHSERSAYSFSIASSDGQVKDYLSPTGDRFESHVMHDDWGVWAGTGPQTMLVTVIDVQGQVDCTGLKHKVGAFEQADDVWDQVCSKRRRFHGVSRQADASYPLHSNVGIHASRPLPNQLVLPRRVRHARLLERMADRVDYQERECDVGCGRFCVGARHSWIGGYSPDLRRRS